VWTRSAYNILDGKSEATRSYRIPRRRWDNNIKMDIREIGWEGVDWMHIPQDKDQ
jgi:hypothetical protein